MQKNKKKVGKYQLSKEKLSKSDQVLQFPILQKVILLNLPRARSISKQRPLVQRPTDSQNFKQKSFCRRQKYLKARGVRKAQLIRNITTGDKELDIVYTFS